MIEAARRVTGAYQAGGEGMGTETGSRDGTFAGGTGPGDISLVEGVCGDRGVRVFGGTGLDEEEGEWVLVLVEGDSGQLDTERLDGRSFGVPEVEALNGPVEDGGQGSLKLGSELGGFVASKYEGDGDGLEVLAQGGEVGWELGEFGCGKPENSMRLSDELRRR
jgi:hypothetical protein